MNTWSKKLNEKVAVHVKILPFAFKWEGSSDQSIIISTPLHEKFVVIAMFCHEGKWRKDKTDFGITVHVDMKQIRLIPFLEQTYLPGVVVTKNCQYKVVHSFKSAIHHQKSEDLGWIYTSGLEAQF